MQVTERRGQFFKQEPRFAQELQRDHLRPQHGNPTLIRDFPDLLENRKPLRENEARNLLRKAGFLLEELAAPFCNLHGTMMEVCGLGVFLEGPAGVGKSETALGLIKRGHALVADDFTHFRRTGNATLMASAREQTRGFMEIRGIGLINVTKAFGIGALRGEKQLDLVITLRRQEDCDELDRIGTEIMCEFLGVSVRQLLLPVALGRDLVNLVETAAQEYVLRASGYRAVDDLDAQLKQHHTEGEM